LKFSFNTKNHEDLYHSSLPCTMFMRSVVFISKNEDVSGSILRAAHPCLKMFLRHTAALVPGRLRFAVHLLQPLKRHKSATRLVIIIIINITVMRPNSFRRNSPFYFKCATHKGKRALSSAALEKLYSFAQ
jgi:hypothetical protein